MTDIPATAHPPGEKVEEMIGITREDMCTWSVAEVGEWLHHTGISALTVGFFAGRGIDGSGLLHLTLNELVCMQLPWDDVGRMCKAVLEEYSAECAQQHEAHEAKVKEDLEMAGEQCVSAQDDVRHTREKLLAAQVELRQHVDDSCVACEQAERREVAAQDQLREAASRNTSLMEHLEKAVADRDARRDDLMNMIAELETAERKQTSAEAHIARLRAERNALEEQLLMRQASVERVKAVNVAERRDGTYRSTVAYMLFENKSWPGLKNCDEEALRNAFLTDVAECCRVPSEQVWMEIIFLDDGTLRLDVSVMHAPYEMTLLETLRVCEYSSVKTLRDAAGQQIE